VLLPAELKAQIEISPPPLSDEKKYREFLKDRYGFSPERIRFTKNYAMMIQGSDESGFAPPVECSDSTPLWTRTHTAIIGGGPSGLTAAVYLTDRRKRVFLLEKENELGGSAVGSGGSLSYGRGGAYITDVSKNLLDIYQHLGLGDFIKKQKIPEPVDSYWWNHSYYRGIWESATLKTLPISFSVFKYLIEQADAEGLIPSQPMENHSGSILLDKVSFADWVREMPSELEKRALFGDKKALDLLRAFEESNDGKSPEPMRPVLKLLELYGRSALGDHPENISAAAFTNFYISEIGTRYSSSLGSGFVSKAAVQKLKRRPWFHYKTSSPVGRIVNFPKGVRVCFQNNGRSWRVEAKYAVFAAPIGIAPKIIQDIEIISPEKARAIESMEYRHYQVMNVHLMGHPWHDSYGLWIRNDSTYSGSEVTDLIEGRWFDFEGNKKPRTDDKGVLTLYNPLPKEDFNSGMTEAAVIARAEKAARELETLLNQMLLQMRKPPIHILAIEINRWPLAIHVVQPGYFSEKVDILKKPIGRIFFANNNLGTPAVEEGLFRGFLAAKAILANSGSK